jgi:sugar O-acyltransferase (sialic acid O-acetyltransferase NeuD family)
MKYYGLVGAGGFGRVVMPLLRAQVANELAEGTAELRFVVEGAANTLAVNGIPVVAIEVFSALAGDHYFNIAIADSQTRERIATALVAAGAVPFSIRATNSISLDNNDIGTGAIFCPFTIVTANARIGRFFHANLYSYVEHDCEIGDFVTFAPGVKCNGNVRIEDHAYIGSGAVIRQGRGGSKLTIGKGAVVGMGSIVIQDVPPDTTVIGNPARQLRPK